MTIKRILVPTDFSETSEHAFAVGHSFAQTFGASMYLLHVIPDPYAQPWSVEATGSAIPDLLKTWQSEAQRRLEGLKPRGVETTVETRVGDPFSQIVSYAEEHSVDLIVIGTHGRGPIGHMLLGSVAEKVVRKAPCPVLTVRQPEHSTEES